MLLPPEIFEKIIFYLDYKTLRSAIRVNKQWQAIVFHQAKQRCLREMSRCELADYEHRLWGKCETGPQWAQLYDNWQSWRNISMEVDFQIDPTTFTFSDEMLSFVNCILGEYIAVATIEQIFIYNMDNCIKEFSVLFPKELYFISDENNFLNPSGLVAICDFNTTIFDLHRDLEPLIIDELHVCSVSVLNSRISYVTPNDELRLLQIRRDNTHSLTCETEYVLQMEAGNDPNKGVVAISLTETRCCVLLTCGRFYAVYLDNDHVTKVVENVSFSDTAMNYTWILPNNFLITSHYCELQGVMTSFVETHYLDDCNEDHTLCTKRLVELGSVVESPVCAAAMHGSTLVFGCEDGSLIFYNVDDWRSFNVMNFSHLIRMPHDLHDRVNNIEVYGRGTERVYTVLRQRSVIRVVASMRYIF